MVRRRVQGAGGHKNKTVVRPTADGADRDSCGQRGARGGQDNPYFRILNAPGAGQCGHVRPRADQGVDLPNTPAAQFFSFVGRGKHGVHEAQFPATTAQQSHSSQNARFKGMNQTHTALSDQTVQSPPQTQSGIGIFQFHEGQIGVIGGHGQRTFLRTGQQGFPPGVAQSAGQEQRLFSLVGGGETKMDKQHRHCGRISAFAAGRKSDGTCRDRRI